MKINTIPKLIICALCLLVLGNYTAFAQNQNKVIVVPLLGGNNLGYEKVEVSAFFPVVPSNAGATAIASCPVGKVVTGGGCYTLFAPEFVVQISAAINSTTQWTCTLMNITASNANVTVFSQAFCENQN